MGDDRMLRLLDEIWDELGSLEGVELDEYLASLGLSADELLRAYLRAMGVAGMPELRRKK